MEIINKLNKIQKELKAPKNQYNSFSQFNYRSCEDILEAVKKLLDSDTIVLLEDELVQIGDRYYIKATAILKNGKEEIKASAYAREPDEPKPKMDSSQTTGSTSSYARKYALNGLFCIDDTKDADTMDNTHQKTPQNSHTDTKLPIMTDAIFMTLIEHFKPTDTVEDLYKRLSLKYLIDVKYKNKIKEQLKLLNIK